MKPHRPSSFAAVALTGLTLLSACQPAPPSGWTGYAEAELVYVAAPVAGRITSLSVHPGDAVAAGQALFELDPVLEKAAEAEAQARTLSARAQASNAAKGRRAQEIAVTQAQLAQARSAEQLAASDLTRQRQLVDQGFVTRARATDAATLLAQARARVVELEAALAVAKLPSRSDERASAQALAQAAEQSRAQAAWRVEQKRQSAPLAARVNDVFMRAGEWVPAGQVVLALLPPNQRKARFYVSEAEVGGLKPTDAVQLHCDGCGAAIPARVSFIANGPEYTPPVIYSNAQRAKLVFLVEARPIKPEDAERLRPGQPLNVTR
jgi:HlyD family secretion protein